MAHLLRGAGAVVAPRAGEPVRDINPDDRIVQRLLVSLLSLVVVPTLQRQPLGRAVLCVPLAAEPVGFSAAHEQRSVSEAQRSSARRRQVGALAHPMLGSSGRLDSRMVTTAATSAAIQSCRLSTTSASGTAAAMPARRPGQRARRSVAGQGRTVGGPLAAAHREPVPGCDSPPRKACGLPIRGHQPDPAFGAWSA